MRQDQQNEGEDWIILSDISMGGFIIFLIIAVTFIARHNNLYDQHGIYEAMNSFQSNIIQVDTIYKKGTLRFTKIGQSELFGQGSDKLTPEFQNALNVFLPSYLDTIAKHINKIAEIRIEGHTDTTCIGQNNDCYTLNLDLSSKRANAVVYFILHSDVFAKKSVEEQNKMRRLFVAAGYSYSETLDADGNLSARTGNPANLERSRRVDFRIIINTSEK